MKKVAVTGAAGFIGTNLVRRLIERGHLVTAIDDFSTGLERNISGLPCQISKSSITNMRTLSGALKGSEYIFHLAARGSVPRSLKNPRATIEVNVTGTLNVLECARKYGASIAFSSSSSVYGSNTELPKSEKMWTAPLTPYAASKLAAEGLVQSFANSFGIHTVNYRFFNVFGPWQRPDHDYAAVIPKWIWRLINGEKEIGIFGDGNQTRDFTYVDSVVDTLIQGMELGISHPLPLNLAFGEQISLNQLVDTLRLHFPKFKVIYQDYRQGDVQQSQNDPSELFQVFPKIRKFDFESAIGNTISWFRDSGHLVANGPKVRD